jgi:hypothetical protein
MNEQDLRLSDAERETASQALGEHYAQGRLDADEHHERHERIWSAKTRGEIPPIFADLPGGSPLQAAPRRSAATPSWAAGPRPTYAAPRRRSGLPWPVKALFVIALVALVVTHWPLILIALGVLWLVSHRGSGPCAPGPRRHWSTG